MARVGQVEATHIQIEETGHFVNIRDSPHARTNHYIKQSRPYFKDSKLRTYFDCPYFITLSKLLFFASLFGGLGAVANDVPKTLPVGFLVACVVFVFIFIQHEVVNQTSLPLVLTQPVIPGQQPSNTFYEVAITKLEGVALQIYRSGFGFVRMAHGEIQFQTFNEKAMKTMKQARRGSRVLLFLFFLASGWNLYFVATNYWN